jgi:1,2-diacylglycerol-3-alpha-glucose alpha-1,2-glucosyltransferase
MKICIYFEGANNISKSGIGRAFLHQKQMCEQMGVEYTTDYKDQYDILHINTIFLKSEEAISYARKQKAKVIYHAHTTKEDFEDSFKMSNFLSPGLKVWLKRLYSKADLIITPTEYSKKLLQAYGIVKPIFALSNGIDTKRYQPSIEREEKFIKHFNIRKKDKVFISVGLWFKRKGIIDFINLARLLPQYRFIWFGQINKNSIPTEVVHEMNNLPDNCEFPGYIAGDILLGNFSKANGFIFMSYEETEGIVVLEALASKQAVIIRDIPVYQDWLIDNVDVLKAKSINDFRDKITYLANNDDQKLKNNGYKVALSKDINIIAEQLYKIYQYALSLK